MRDAVGAVQSVLRNIEQAFNQVRAAQVAALQGGGTKDADKTLPPARRLLTNDPTIEKLAGITPTTV